MQHLFRTRRAIPFKSTLQEMDKVVLSKECECTETVLQCLWSTNVLKMPATVGSACLPCVRPVTVTVDPLGDCPHHTVVLRCCFCYQTQ